MESQSDNEVVFSLLSFDGDQGFAGNLAVKVSYRLTDDNQVKIEYWANTDKTTPVNLTNHAYFNLMGGNSISSNSIGDDAIDESTEQDCRTHFLHIDAAEFLPTDAQGIPLGALQSVENTGFDFRQMKPISEHFLQDDQQVLAKGYDHSFFFDPNRDQTKAVARLVSADQQVRMSVVTNKPAMQLYTGNWLTGQTSRDGEYRGYAGVALETQFLPDSPNHPEWQQPSCLLTPEQTYRFHTIYQFDF